MKVWERLKSKFEEKKDIKWDAEIKELVERMYYDRWKKSKKMWFEFWKHDD